MGYQVRLAIAAVVALLVVLSGVTSKDVGPTLAAAQGPTRPNIVLVVSDDQPEKLAQHMPFVSSQPWSKFNNAVYNVALCCPSRATILSGQYSHHTGVNGNGQAKLFREQHTIAKWLDRAGYRTGLFGKYFNTYPFDRGNYIPTGWDQWAAHVGKARHYNYTLNHNGKLERYGTAPREYATNVEGDMAQRFIASADKPFFLYYAPPAPHYPYTPEQRYKGQTDPTSITLPENFNFSARDSPRWVKELGDVNPQAARQRAADQIDMSYSIDNQISKMVELLKVQGEYENTLFIYMSDNGLSNGSHSYGGKDCPYKECTDAPFYIHYPYSAESREIKHVVSNADIAPTIADITNVEPTVKQDGNSLVRYLNGSTDSLGGYELIHSQRQKGSLRPYWGAYGSAWTYWRYSGGFEELYNIEKDPGQMRNLANNQAYSLKVKQMREKTEALRGKRFRN